MREKLRQSSDFIVISSPFAPIVPGVCSSYVGNIMESNEKSFFFVPLNLIHQNFNTTKPQFISAVYLPHSVPTSSAVRSGCPNAPDTQKLCSDTRKISTSCTWLSEHFNAKFIILVKIVTNGINFWPKSMILHFLMLSVPCMSN